MANRFLNNITINDEYTLPAADGSADQVITTDGSGNLSFTDVVAGEADKALSLTLRVKNTESVALTKGQVVCAAPTATPPSGNVIEVKLADNNGTDSMPAIGVLNEGLDAAGGANDEGEAIMFGRISGIDTSAFSVGDEVFVSDTAGGLTTTKPTGVKYIQKVGVVMRDDASNGTIEVFGAGRTNDVPTPLYIDHANQRVGIGEETPSADLHINKDSTPPELRLSFEPASGYGGGADIRIQGGYNDYVYGGIGWYNGANRDANFYYAAASREMSFRVNERGVSSNGYFRFYNGSTEVAEINPLGIYGNVFYDQGNTAYYLNPASTSTSLNVAGSARVDSLFIGNQSGQISNRVWFDNGSSNTPGLYFEGGQPKFIIYSSVSNIFHDTYHPNADTWTTGRTITIGGTGKTVDGSANVSWSLSEIGAAAASHNHDSDYVNVTGDTMTGTLTVPNLTIGSGNKIKFANNDYIRYDDANGVGRFHFDADGGTNNASVQAATFVGALSTTGISGSNYNITGVNQLSINDPGEGILFGGGANNVTLYAIDDSTDNKMNFAGASELQVNGSKVFHDGYHPNADTWTTARTITIGSTGKSVNGSANVSWSLSEIGAAPSSHSHDDRYYTESEADGRFVNVAGDTMTGDLTVNGHIYGRSVNGQYSNLYRMGGVYFTWDSDSYGTNFNHSITSTSNGVYGDDITINSYGNVRINIDSNSNGVDTFSVGHHSTGTGGTLLTLDESGNHTVTGSSRAPIFYDSNNTAYYVDPASNSIYNTAQGNYLGLGTSANTSGTYRLNMGGSIDMNGYDVNYVSQLHFNDNVRFYDDGNDSYLNFKYGDTNAGGIKFLDGSGNQKGFLYADSTGFGLLDIDGDWAVRTQTGQGPLELRCDNNIEFSVFNSYTLSYGSSRAPIFYDSNNTSYYLDPASSSVVNDLRGTRIWAGYDANVDNSISCSEWFRSSGNTGWYNASYGGGIYMVDSTWVRVYNNKKFYANNTIESNTGMYAPIFYDRNDTNYYVNPASTSNLNTVTISGYLQSKLIQYQSTNWRKNYFVRSVGVTGSEIGDKWVHLMTVTNTSGYAKFKAKFKIDGYDDVSSGEERIDVIYENASTGQENHQCFWGGGDGLSSLFKEVKSIRTSSSGLNNTYQVWVKMEGDWRDTFTVEVEWFSSAGTTPTFPTSIGTTTNPAGNNDISKTYRALHFSSALEFGPPTDTSDRGIIHYGSSGKIGQASTFDPNNGQNGFWIEGTQDNESGGIFMNGNTFALWSPGDADILNVYDEDAFSAGPKFIVSGNGTVQAAGPVYGTVFYDKNNSTYYMDGSSTGDSIRVAGDVVAYYSSDKRYKDNIKPIENALDKVNAISGVTFEWNEKSHKTTGKKDVGVVAQEVEEVFPEIVETRSNGYKAVDYQKLTAVLIESVKELTVKVEALEAKQCNCK